MVRLSEAIWYTPPVAEPDRPVLALIRGQRRTLMVDGGNSPGHARDFLKELRIANLPEPDLVAVTHAHCDHLFGLGELAGLVMANRLTNERMTELAGQLWDDQSLEERVASRTEFRSTLSMLRIEMPADRKELVVRTADIVYNDELEVELGGMRCLLRRVGGPHTEDSAIVCVPQESVTFLGDCLYNNGNDAKVLEELYATLMALETEMFVDSHLESPIKRTELRSVLFS